jgi:predicted nucleotidyltransferase
MPGRRDQVAVEGPPRMISFPTPLHQEVAEVATDFFAGRALVDTVLIVNSCARGQATPDSDVDLAVLVNADTTTDDLQALERSWRDFAATQPLVSHFKQSGRFTQVHLDLFDGQFVPSVWDDGGGPDTFEVEVGNRVAYAAPLATAGPHYRRLQAHWLPYYSDDLRRRRLAMVRHACMYDLDHVAHYHERGLSFQAFDRLYKAFQEFLQALFIARRTYPLMYTKWVREQVQDWLGLPDLYQELPPILSIGNIESAELVRRADALHSLLDRWVQL